MSGLGWDWDIERELERLEWRMAEKRRAHEGAGRAAHRRGEIMIVTLPGLNTREEVWTLAIKLG